MECRHVVVIGHPCRVAGARIAAGLDEKDARPGLDQARRERAAPRARADDDVVPLESFGPCCHGGVCAPQNVFRKAIRARLS